MSRDPQIFIYQKQASKPLNLESCTEVLTYGTYESYESKTLTSLLAFKNNIKKQLFNNTDEL